MELSGPPSNMFSWKLLFRLQKETWTRTQAQNPPPKSCSTFKISWGNGGAQLAGVVNHIWFNLRHRPQKGVYAQYCQEMETRLPKDLEENQSKLEKSGMETE